MGREENMTGKLMISVLLLLIMFKFILVLIRLSKELSAMSQQKEEERRKEAFAYAQEREKLKREREQRAKQEEANRQKAQRERAQYKRSYEQKKERTSSEDFHIPTPWEILGVLYGCELSHVKKRYRVLARQYHPDYAKANGVDEDEAIQKMQRINAAYEEIIRSFR